MENKSKHTPGPWEAFNYDPKSPGYKAGKAYGIVSDDGTPAFTVYKSQKFDHRAGKTGHFWDPAAKAKDRANAALIAAAPELLAALENALNVLAGIATGDLKTVKADSPAIAQARAAIAQARQG